MMKFGYKKTFQPNDTMFITLPERIEQTREYITRHWLLHDDVKLVKREDLIYIIAKREIELEF